MVATVATTAAAAVVAAAVAADAASKAATNKRLERLERGACLNVMKTLLSEGLRKLERKKTWEGNASVLHS